ncbi:MAG: lipopolysaccharide biosynthesis protein [Candidatus Rokuibacteriota bacterium]
MSSAPEAVLHQGVPPRPPRGGGEPGFAVLAARGSGWIGSAQAAKLGIQVALMALLARLLRPEDFGLFAMAAVFVDLFLMLSDFDAGSIVVARRELAGRALSSLFWLVLLVSVSVGAVTFALTPWLVGVYGDPRLEPVLRLLTLCFAVGPPGAIAVGMIERRLDFRLVAMVDTLSLATAAVIAATLAFWGWGVLSLVGLTVGVLAARAVLACAVAKWRPAPVLSLAGLGGPVRFGVTRTAHRTLYVVHKHADAFLLGRYVGAAGLGHYRLASQLILTPLLNLASVVWRVSFPLFASIQGEPGRISAGYLRAIGWLALVTFPALGWMLGSAAELVLVLFGPQWEPAVPLVRIFCLAGIPQVLVATLDPILLALGRSDLLLRLEALTLPINILPLLVGIRWGPEGVAWAFLGALTITVLVRFRLANGVLRLSPARYGQSLLWPVVAMVAAAGGAMLAGFVAGNETGALGRLLWETAAAGVAVGGVLWFGRPPVLGDALQMATAVMRGAGRGGRHDRR